MPDEFGLLGEQSSPAPSHLIIRPAAPGDSDGIARVFAESAAHHEKLDPARYFQPSLSVISERYRTGRQHPRRPTNEIVTLVADVEGDILGFVDARLERPIDAMHRPTIYCYIAEIAVGSQHRSKGLGQRLLLAAEEWGRERGAEFASLDYNAANSRAGSFYQKRMGYSVASITVIKRLQAAARL